MQIVKNQRRIEFAVDQGMGIRFLEINRPKARQVSLRGKPGIHEAAQRLQFLRIAIGEGDGNIGSQNGETVTAVAAGQVKDAALDGQGLDE